MDPNHHPDADPSPPSLLTDDGLGPARCLGCLYALRGLPSPGDCPECGREFNLADPRTFTTKAPFIGWVFWLPGLLLAVVGGTFVAAAMVSWQGNWGYALWMGVPMAAGSVLGYRFRARYTLIPLVVLVALGGLILGVMLMDLAGVFCALMLAAIYLGPVIAGTTLGILLRLTLKGTRFSQRWYLPAIGMLLVPLGLGAIEGPPRRHAPESITTERLIAAPPDAVWAALQFYEEVRHEPPLLLRIGLAHPLSTSGSSSVPGDVKVCIYNKGRISKRITAVAAPNRLRFEVVEQQIGYERDVRLIGGSFELAPEGGASTRVRLTTTYEPLLTPRWCWRPAERLAVGLLHGHVLEGMAIEAGGQPVARGDAVRRRGAGVPRGEP